MSNTDHTTRTLLLSQKVPGMLLVCRGSNSNLDLLAEQINSGHSQIKAFNISSITEPHDFSRSGTLLGWGLRNSVGVAEHPETGGIFSVENGADDVTRDGQDIHENNPGEEMNFHGYLNGTSYSAQGQNYGYPKCHAVWNVSEIPDNGNLTIGSSFAIGDQNATVNDNICDSTTIPARLTFPAHWAPLDIKFNGDGTTAWVTAHGSWNRGVPTGYLLFAVDFNNGQPSEPANSTVAAIPIVVNQDTSVCPDSCFRPVGLAWDNKGRLFMSSDSTGEIYVITRTDGISVFNSTPTSVAPPSATTSKAFAAGLEVQELSLWGVIFGMIYLLL
jgi:glucose/arabinose dehydrogenase